MNLQTNYTIRLLRTMDEIEGFARMWRAWQHNPTADYDYFRLIVSSRSNVLGPYVLVIFRNGEAVGLLIGRIETTHVECRFGYKVLFRPTVKSITIVEGGYLGPDDPEIARALVTYLVRALRAKHADVVMFGIMPTESALFKMTQAVPSRWIRDSMVKATAHFSIHLPESMDAFMARLSQKHRYSLRRLERQLVQDSALPVSFRSLNRPEDVAQLCRDAEIVAAKTYHRRLGFGFKHDAERERRLELEAREGWLRSQVLYVGDEPKAFWTTLVHKGICYLAYTGYDPDFKQYSPGTILLLKIIEGLCAEKITHIDCGSGSAPYKERFGIEDRQESGAMFYSPSLKGVAMNMMRTSINGLAIVAKLVLARFGAMEKVKKYWRFNVSRTKKIAVAPNKEEAVL